MQTFASALLWLSFICFGYFILRNIKHWILSVIGEMVLRGLWFPKIMKAAREESEMKIHTANRKIDRLVDRIENAKSREEIDQLIREVHNV